MDSTQRDRRGRHRLRTVLIGAIVALVASIGVVLTSTVASASTPTATATSTATCPTVYWGSLAKSKAGSTTAPITGVRAGRHSCYDRVVVDLGAGRGPIGYSVRYVASVRQEGSGKVVPLRGGAKIEVVVRAPAYNVRTGAPTYTPANRAELVNVAGYATLRQIAFAGSFEGQTTLGVGVRARLPFRVFTLAGPGNGHRLVIDIAHHW